MFLRQWFLRKRFAHNDRAIGQTQLASVLLTLRPSAYTQEQSGSVYFDNMPNHLL
jgi:hypothetical protein